MRLSAAQRAHVGVVIGGALVVLGVGLVAGLGAALIAAGIALVAGCLLLVDVGDARRGEW